MSDAGNIGRVPFYRRPRKPPIKTSGYAANEQRPPFLIFFIIADDIELFKVQTARGFTLAVFKKGGRLCQNIFGGRLTTEFRNALRVTGISFFAMYPVRWHAQRNLSDWAYPNRSS